MSAYYKVRWESNNGATRDSGYADGSDYGYTFGTENAARDYAEEYARAVAGRGRVVSSGPRVFLAIKPDGYAETVAVVKYGEDE